METDPVCLQILFTDFHCRNDQNLKISHNSPLILDQYGSWRGAKKSIWGAKPPVPMPGDTIGPQLQCWGSACVKQSAVIPYTWDRTSTTNSGKQLVRPYVVFCKNTDFMTNWPTLQVVIMQKVFSLIEFRP